MKQLKVVNFIAIAIGAAIMGAGINAFNIANNLAEGGVAGIAILLKWTLDLDPGLMTFLMNIPLLIIGLKVLGRYTLIYTLFGITCLSLALSLFGWMRYPLDDMLLAALFAGVTIGLGLGLIFRFGGTTGGVDIIGRIFHKYFGWKIGRTMFIADLGVVLLSLVYLDVQQAMYTVVVVFIGTRVVDFMQDAAYSMRAAMIFSSSNPRIASKIMDEMNRGVTLLKGRGAYSGDDREIIYTVVGRSEVVRLKALIHSVDPSAFVAISEAMDVQGEGFTLDESKRPLFA